jgi:hypothetical protein
MQQGPMIATIATRVGVGEPGVHITTINEGFIGKLLVADGQTGVPNGTPPHLK